MNGSAGVRSRLADHELHQARRPRFLVRCRAMTSRQSEACTPGSLALVELAGDALVDGLTLLQLVLSRPRGERAVGRRPIG